MKKELTNKSVIILFAFLLFVTSCATSNIKDNVILNNQKKEGIYFTNIKVNQLGWSIAIFPRTTKKDRGVFGSAAAVIEQLHEGDNFIIISLPEGSYAIQYVYNSPFAFEVEPMDVQIFENKICYIGQFEIDVINKSKYFPDFKYRYVNDFDNALIYLSSSYPSLYNGYITINCYPSLSNPNWMIPRQKI